MLRASLLLAISGLVLNALFWGAPGLIAASGNARAMFPTDVPTLAHALAAAERKPGATPSVPDALLSLMSAEADAMEVAGVAIQNPHTPQLGQRADAAGHRVLQAVQTYLRAVDAALK